MTQDSTNNAHAEVSIPQIETNTHTYYQGEVLEQHK